MASLREHRIAAGVIAVMMRVDDESNGLLGDLPDFGKGRLGQLDGLPVPFLRVVVVVDHQHALVGDEHADVAADLAHVGTVGRDDRQPVGELVNL